MLTSLRISLIHTHRAGPGDPSLCSHSSPVRWAGRGHISQMKTLRPREVSDLLESSYKSIFKTTNIFKKYQPFTTNEGETDSSLVLSRRLDIEQPLHQSGC